MALVLDTFIPPQRRQTPQGFPDLEAAISLCASIADILARGEYIIDLFAAGPELYVFRAGRHTAHFDNVLEILACLDHCRENPFQTLTPAIVDELANITTLILVALRWDDARARLVQAAEECGCHVKVILVSEDAPGPEAPPTPRDFSHYSTADVLSGRLDSL